MILAGAIDEPAIRRFLIEDGGLPAVASATSVLGFLSDEREPLGGWMLERYTGPGGSVVAHWHGKKGAWLTRDVLTMAAIYMFDELKVNTVWGEVRASDTYTRRLDEKLGFRLVTILSGYFPDDDLALYSLAKQECPWLPAAFKDT